MKKPLYRLAVPILALPRAAKRLVALLVDLGVCVLTVWLAYSLRLGEFVALSGTALWAVVASTGIALPIFIVSGLYRAIFRYSGWPAFDLDTPWRISETGLRSKSKNTPFDGRPVQGRVLRTIVGGETVFTL